MTINEVVTPRHFSVSKLVRYTMIASLILISAGSHAKMFPTRSMPHKYLSIAAIMSFKYVQDAKFHNCAQKLFDKNTIGKGCKKYFDEILLMSQSKVYRDISGTLDPKFREIIDFYLRVHNELDQRGVLEWKNRQQEVYDAITESLGVHVKEVIDDYK